MSVTVAMWLGGLFVLCYAVFVTVGCVYLWRLTATKKKDEEERDL